MHLYINTTDGETIHLALAQKGPASDSRLTRDGGLVAEKTIPAHHQQSELLLAEIDTLLQEAQVTKGDLRGIVVTSGPGKFTATRIGVTTANALAYALNIPVAGVSAKAYDSIQTWIAAGNEALGESTSWHMNQAVAPEYGGEPNISQPKKSTEGGL